MKTISELTISEKAALEKILRPEIGRWLTESGHFGVDSTEPSFAWRGTVKVEQADIFSDSDEEFSFRRECVESYAYKIAGFFGYSKLDVSVFPLTFEPEENTIMFDCGALFGVFRLSLDAPGQAVEVALYIRFK